jgi:hypothetical protein
MLGQRTGATANFQHDIRGIQVQTSDNSTDHGQVVKKILAEPFPGDDGLSGYHALDADSTNSDSQTNAALP